MEAREYFDEDDRHGNEQLAAAEIKANNEAIEERKRQEAENAAQKPEAAAEAAPPPAQDSGGDEEDEHLKSIGDRAAGGGIVVGTGTRLADDRSWEKDYDAMRNRQAIARAGRLAAQDARNDLLASGKYFDDGRGNIKLKQRYRSIQRVGNGGRRTYNETLADDGSAARYIANARRQALDAAAGGLADDGLQPQAATRLDKAIGRTRSAIAANRVAEKERIQENDERKANEAKSRLSLFDGFASALNSLRRNAAEAEGDIMSVWGGKDENGRDARWKYDEQGRVVGQADARQAPRPGKDGARAAGSVRNGFVEPNEIRAINANLRQRGANYAVTGIMAQQAYGAIGKPMDGTEPVFYVQGVKNDGTRFGRYMTMKDVYRMGVENYRTANGAAAKDGDAEMFATEGLGGYDPYGFMKNRSVDVKMDIAKMNADLRERIAKMNNENRIEVAGIKANSAAESARARAESGERIAKMNAESRERIAKMRIDNRRISGEDMRNLADILSSPLYDDETKSMAKEAFNDMVSRITGGGAASPAQGETPPKEAVKPSAEPKKEPPKEVAKQEAAKEPPMSTQDDGQLDLFTYLSRWPRLREDKSAKPAQEAKQEAAKEPPREPSKEAAKEPAKPAQSRQSQEWEDRWGRNLRKQ